MSYEITYLLITYLKGTIPSHELHFRNTDYYKIQNKIQMFKEDFGVTDFKIEVEIKDIKEDKKT